MENTTMHEEGINEEEPMEETKAESEEEQNETEEASTNDAEEEDEEEDDDDDEDDDEDEEDPIDPFETQREKCASTKACADMYAIFEQCESRVTSKKQTEENCSEEILDFFHCQDTCAAKGILAKLK